MKSFKSSSKGKGSNNTSKSGEPEGPNSSNHHYFGESSKKAKKSSNRSNDYSTHEDHIEPEEKPSRDCPSKRK